MRRPGRQAFAVILAALIAAAAPVWAVPAPVPADTVIRAPGWQGGSTWYYSDGYGLKVSSSSNGLTVFERLDAPGQWFSRQGFLRKDLVSATATRNSIYLTLPDQTGASLSAAAPLTFQREYLSNGKLVVHTSSWTLEGRETITVPAGTFDCFVIVWRTRSLRSDWTGYERWWFSPAAQNYVRMEYKYGPAEAGSRVLMRYTLSQRADMAPALPEKLAALAPESIPPAAIAPPPAAETPAAPLPQAAAAIPAVIVPEAAPDLPTMPAETAATRPAEPLLPPAILTPPPPVVDVASLPAPEPELPLPAIVAPPVPAVTAQTEPAPRQDRAEQTATDHVWRVQLASSKDEKTLRADFDKIVVANARRFDGLPTGVSSAQIAGRGTFYRAWVGAFASARQAEKLCGELKTNGGACAVMRVRNDGVAAG